MALQLGCFYPMVQFLKSYRASDSSQKYVHELNSKSNLLFLMNLVSVQFDFQHSPSNMKGRMYGTSTRRRGLG